MLVKANSQQRPDKVDILSKGEDSANNFAVDHPVAQSCGKLCQCGGGSSSTNGYVLVDAQRRYPHRRS